MPNYAYVAVLSANVISFIAGTSLTWSSPVIPKLEELNDDNPFGRAITDAESSWIGSLVPLGAVFGPFIYGYAAARFGRKLTLTSLGLPFIVTYIILAFADTMPLYYFARFLGGLAVGGVFTVIPMYVGEVAEDSNRGALGTIMNVFITAGLLFSYSVGPYVSLRLFNILLAVFPCIFMLLFMFLAPESPHYFVGCNKHLEAEQSLHKLRGSTNLADTQKELEEIKNGIQTAGTGAVLDIFRSRGLTKAFVISLCLVGFQQFSGINVVLFYTQDIFRASGSTIPAAVSSIIVGGVQFGTSFVTPLVVDRLGRRILLIFSAGGMLLAEIPLGLYFFWKKNDHDVSAISWLPVVALIAYIITYNCGFGPLPWAVMGELFPANIKSIASSVTACFCWFLGFLITRFFKSLSESEAFGMGPSFWLFAGFCGVAVVFTMFFLVETKGKSLQEIQDALNN